MSAATIYSTNTAQSEAVTPEAVFRYAVEQFNRHGIEQWQPSKLSKMIRDRFRLDGSQAAVELVDDYVRAVGRGLYLATWGGFQKFAVGYADVTGGLAARNLDSVDAASLIRTNRAAAEAVQR